MNIYVTRPYDTFHPDPPHIHTNLYLIKTKSHPPQIRNRVNQADIDDGRRDGLTTAERDELRHLRQECRILGEEKEIEARAAPWFAEQSPGSTPRRRSGS